MGTTTTFGHSGTLSQFISFFFFNNDVIYHQNSVFPSPGDQLLRGKNHQKQNQPNKNKTKLNKTTPSLNWLFLKFYLLLLVSALQFYQLVAETLLLLRFINLFCPPSSERVVVILRMFHLSMLHAALCSISFPSSHP